MVIKKGSMREVINSIYQLLINDDELMRQLWYKPKRETGIDPLDSSLRNVVDMEDYWDIVDDRIMLAEKVNDLINKPICRLYISSGRRRGVFGSYPLATQEVVIAIYTHEDYETDGRCDSIGDRINKLIALEEVEGTMGRIEYRGGNPRGAPIQYKKYEHIYEYVTGKK